MILPTIFAATPVVDNCPGENTGDSCSTTLPQVLTGNSDQFVNGLKVVFGIAVGVALISLAIAAFNFATAGTDADKISRSKNGIVFALIGLVITLSAEAIVLTVLSRL